MNIEALLDLACATVANMIKGKTPEEIRKTFNIVVSLLSQCLNTAHTLQGMSGVKKHIDVES